MSDPKQEKPKEFEPVGSPEEMLRFLTEGAKTLASAMIWTENQEIVIQTHLTMMSQTDKVFYAWLPQQLDLKNFIETLDKKGTRDCFFSLSLKNANLFFKTRFKENDTVGLKFEIPIQVFKVQRRSNFRFKIPEGHVLKVEFPDPLFPETVLSKKVFDISAGGISFITYEKDTPIYQQGLVIEDFRFTLKTKLINTGVEIRHAKTFPANSMEQGLKVGVVFKNMSDEQVQWIASYVFEESRKYFSRFIE